MARKPSTWSVIVDDGDGNWYPVATGLTWMNAAGMAIKELATRNARLLESADNY